MSRPKTRFDGRKCCYWFPTAFCEKVDRIAKKLGVSRGAAIIAAIDAFDDRDEQNAAENIRKQRELEKLDTIKKILE